MTTIPKPKHCDQNWLEMRPTEGGRVCLQCNKVIFDFSKLSWAEIEHLQKQNNNAICGMYTPKQLSSWGKELPSHKRNLLKFASVTGLSVTLSFSAYSQTNNPADSIIISGKVTDKDTGEQLISAKVRLMHNKIGTITDKDGNFNLAVDNTQHTKLMDTLEVIYVGYKDIQIIFNDLTDISKTDNYDNLVDGKLNLALVAKEGTSYSVTEPTFIERILWHIKRWFGRN